MKRIARKQIAGNVPTASMADIAFLLIIFFMVTTKFDVDKTKVEMPKAENRSEVAKGSAYVVIHCLDPGMTGPDCPEYGYKWSDGEMSSIPVGSLTDMESYVAVQLGKDSTTPFIIKADGDTPYQYVDDTFDMLRRVGASDLTLLSDQLTVDDIQ